MSDFRSYLWIFLCGYGAGVLVRDLLQAYHLQRSFARMEQRLQRVLQETK